MPEEGVKKRDVIIYQSADGSISNKVTFAGTGMWNGLHIYKGSLYDWYLFYLTIHDWKAMTGKKY